MRIPTAVMDLFVCLLIVFIVSAMAESGYYSDVQEQVLPPIDLTAMEASSGSAGLTENEYLSVSISARDEFFIEEQKVSFDDLGRQVRAAAPREVCLRVDDNVPHGTVMRVIRELTEHDVTVVSFAFKQTSPEEG